MNKLVHIFILVMLLCGCTSEGGSGASDKPTILVSIEPQRKIVEEIAGDRYNVVTVLTNGANPETYEPTVAQRMATSDAEAFFVTGFLPFEATISKGMKDGAQVYDLSKGIDLVTGTHSHGDEHIHEADPHVWASLVNGKIIAANARDALSALDPENKDAYSQNYDKLASRLDSLNTVAAKSLEGGAVHAFAVWHPSLSYYARDYGLHQISVGQESKETSLNRMKDIVNEAKEDSVKVFFFQKEFDSRQAESINREIGSRLITIDPMNYDWENELMKITDELVR